MIFLKEAFFFPLMAYGLGVCTPCALCWYHAMSVGSALAKDDVVEVMKKVTQETLKEKQTWNNEVRVPTTNLATSTMPALSDGFGRGTGIATITCWVVATMQFMNILRLMASDDPSQSTEYAGTSFGVVWAYARSGLPMILTAIAPALIAYDVASVSSMCDHLHQRINGLRLHDGDMQHDQAVHEKTYPLLFTIERLNAQQGLGFVVFSVVIDKRTLNIIAATVVSVAGAVLPLIVTLMPDKQTSAAQEGVAGNCAMTPLQADGVRLLFRSNESSCDWSNVTIGSIIAN